MIHYNASCDSSDTSYSSVSIYTSDNKQLWYIMKNLMIKIYEGKKTKKFGQSFCDEIFLWLQKNWDEEEFVF